MLWWTYTANHHHSCPKLPVDLLVSPQVLYYLYITSELWVHTADIWLWLVRSSTCLVELHSLKTLRSAGMLQLLPLEPLWVWLSGWRERQTMCRRKTHIGLLLEIYLISSRLFPRLFGQWAFKMSCSTDNKWWTGKSCFATRLSRSHTQISVSTFCKTRFVCFSHVTTVS